ncbi:dihydroxyacetone kinase family protein [Actinomycetospora straminea]|uniref:dihydroxyacetone kinase family protein n=1 Tax=Actinomycetospora straminea TaxID=663607 RepID=UPI002367076B|nr:dihydroxyacetone kinase family protein [Actinomycetospora straminea]
MKKLINATEDVVPEALTGVARVTEGAALVEGHRALVRTDRTAGRVAVLSGGGSGHEPAFAGYVGPGHLDGAVCGEVFASPGVDAVLAAIRAVDDPTLLVVMNYTGDRLNFGLAAQLARAEGRECAMITVADDVALDADDDVTAGRRGLAGTVLVTKVAGAAAAAGRSLDEVTEAAQAAAAAVGTMGLALAPATVPGGEAGFSLGDEEIEIGLGIHGEPGVRRESLRGADELVDELVATVCDDRAIGAGDRVVVLVNGTGATPPMELSIVLRRAVENLGERGVTVERGWSGTFLSSIDMAGVSVALLPVDDDRLALIDAPARSAGWPSGSGVLSGSASEPVPSVAVPGETTPTSGDGTGRLRGTVEAVGRAVRDAEDHLTELDAATGDGDLGTSLSRGAKAVLDDLDATDLDDPVATLRMVAASVRRAIGGTSGPLLATALLHAAEHLDAGGSPDEALRAAADGIADLGGARRGDRTLLDALYPAADALASSGSMTDAADAAAEGAEATATMTPRRGRSSYLGERAHGHRDAGAEAVVIVLRALAEA